jgi:hypothetical protein
MEPAYPNTTLTTQISITFIISSQQLVISDINRIAPYQWHPILLVDSLLGGSSVLAP